MLGKHMHPNAHQFAPAPINVFHHMSSSFIGAFAFVSIISHMIIVQCCSLDGVDRCSTFMTHVSIVFVSVLIVLMHVVVVCDIYVSNRSAGTNKQIHTSSHKHTFVRISTLEAVSLQGLLLLAHFNTLHRISSSLIEQFPC